MGRISLAPLESEESIVAELTAWRSGGGTESGLFHAGVEAIGDDGSPRDIRLFVKAKSQDTQSIDVAVALAGLASPTLRDEVHRFRDDLGLSRSHLRELAIYQLDDAGIRAHTPRPVLIERDDSRRRWVVVLESIADAALINANDPARWDDESIDAALAGLASIHSAWLGRTSELMRQPWLVPRDESKWIELAPLWRELARHAHVRSTAFAAPRLRRIHDELVEDVAAWAGVLASMPRTLIHNDFNPRNIALRSDSGGLRLCAFDWELATIGAPQRDLAEFLSFVLPPDAAREARSTLGRTVSVAARCRIRRRVSAHRVGTRIPRRALRAAGGPIVFLCDDRPRPPAALSPAGRSKLDEFVRVDR